MRSARWFLSGLLFTTGVARADDSKKDSITVLPWTQASIVFAESDKAAVVSYTQLFDDRFMFYGKASAPIDSDTRVAAFTDQNHLVKGFSGSFQLGYDDRAKVLGDLERQVQLAIDGTKALNEGTIGQAIPFDDVLAYKARHPDAPVEASAALKRHFCTQAGAQECNDAVIARYLCKTFATIGCGVEAQDDKAIYSATNAAGAVANEPVCTMNPTSATDAQRDRCFLARWWLGVRGFADADRKITQLVVDDATTELLWRILELADPDAAKKLGGEIKATDPAGKKRERNLLLLDNLDTFKTAVVKLKRTNAIARRDLLMTGLLGKPTEPAQALGIGLDVSYDSLSVHHDDLAAKAVDDKKYDLTVAVDYTYYATVPGLSFNVRAGVGRTANPKAKKAELCTQFPSSDPVVTGKNCDANALFRMGPAPEPVTSEFARAALTYQYGVGRSEDEVVPGVEARATYERTGSDDAVSGRISLFATPIKDATAARVGIALDVGYLINIGEADTRWRITPLVFIGASFSQLQSSGL